MAILFLYKFFISIIWIVHIEMIVSLLRLYTSNKSSHKVWDRNLTNGNVFMYFEQLMSFQRVSSKEGHFFQSTNDSVCILNICLISSDFNLSILTINLRNRLSIQLNNHFGRNKFLLVFHDTIYF